MGRHSLRSGGVLVIRDKEQLEPASLYEKASGSIAVPVHRLHEDPAASSSTVVLPDLQKKRGNKHGKKGKGKGKNKNKSAEICFDWNRNASGCKVLCPNGPTHCCEGCQAPNVRVIDCGCGMGPPAAKKLKGGGKGKGL